MSSKADIANQALGYIGVADEIQDLDSETSKEATACRRFYYTSVGESLRDFRWPFATVLETLALVTDFTAIVDSTSEWSYSYRYPSGCAMIHRILNQISRIETTRSRVPYKIGRDSVGKLIYTDQVNAQVEMTDSTVDTEQFTDDVVTAIALLLASKIAARFGPEAVKLGDRALKLYVSWRAQAQKNALMEEQPDRPGESSFVLARGGLDPLGSDDD